MSTLKKFKIDTGNSSIGPCGFVAYVSAESPDAALTKLREYLDRDGYMVEDGIHGEPPEQEFKVIVYLNPANVTIDEVEEDRAEETAETETQGAA